MTLLLSLPDETILKILSLLDAKDVLAFGIVNRRCHKVSNESLLWYSLCHHQSMAEPTFRKEMEMPVPVASHCPDSPTFDWKSEWRWRFGKLRAFDTSHGIANHSGIVWNIVHSEDSEYAFSSGSDGAIKYWKLMPAPDGGKDFGCVRTIFAAEGIGKVDPNVVGESTTIQKWGERALVCSWRGYIRILDIEYGRFVASIPASPSPISSILPLDLPQPQFCATGDSSGCVRLWDFRVPPTRHSHPTFTWDTEGTVLSLAQTDQLLVAGGRFRSLMMFNLRAGKLERAVFTGGHVHSLHVGSRPGTLISGSGDRRGGILTTWDVSVGTQISRYCHPMVPHASFISCVTGNATHIVTTSWDGVVSLWDTGLSPSFPPRVILDIQPRGAASFTCASVGQKRLLLGHFGGVSVVELEGGRFAGHGQAEMTKPITDEFWEEDEEALEGNGEEEQSERVDLWRVFGWGASLFSN